MWRKQGDAFVTRLTSGVVQRATDLRLRPLVHLRVGSLQIEMCSIRICGGATTSMDGFAPHPIIHMISMCIFISDTGLAFRDPRLIRPSGIGWRRRWLSGERKIAALSVPDREVAFASPFEVSPEQCGLGSLLSSPRSCFCLKHGSSALRSC